MKISKEENKQEILERIIYVKILPFLHKVLGRVPEHLSEVLKCSCKIITAIEYQYIEEAGSSDDGHLIFIESGIAQNFYYDPVNKKYITNHISKKHDVIIDVNSFLYNTDRIGNVQMLEDGIVVSISFSNLRQLLTDFPVLHIIQWQLEAEREKQSVYYQYLLKLKLDDRVRTYIEDNPGIATRIHHNYIANYLGTCRARFSTAYTKYRNTRAKAV